MGVLIIGILFRVLYWDPLFSEPPILRRFRLGSGLEKRREVLYLEARRLRKTEGPRPEMTVMMTQPCRRVSKGDSCHKAAVILRIGTWTYYQYYSAWSLGIVPQTLF